jgi:hypothetical protein
MLIVNLWLVALVDPVGYDRYFGGMPSGIVFVLPFFTVDPKSNNNQLRSAIIVKRETSFARDFSSQNPSPRVLFVIHFSS